MCPDRCGRCVSSTVYRPCLRPAADDAQNRSSIATTLLRCERSGIPYSVKAEMVEPSERMSKMDMRCDRENLFHTSAGRNLRPSPELACIVFTASELAVCGSMWRSCGESNRAAYTRLYDIVLCTIEGTSETVSWSCVARMPLVRRLNCLA